MKEITVGLPVKVVVDVLRQASKVNIMLKFINELKDLASFKSVLINLLFNKLDTAYSMD